MGRLRTFVICAGLLAGPATALSHEKRTDRCGCHQQYGLRHCHPSKRTQGCEAPARAPPPVRTEGRRAVPAVK